MWKHILKLKIVFYFLFLNKNNVFLENIFLVVFYYFMKTILKNNYGNT